MRQLTEAELGQLFQKLGKYIDSANIKQLLERSDDVYEFRVHKDRVYYLSENLLKKAGHVARKQLVSAGVCFGKFTSHANRQFRLGITALDFLARLAQYKVWLKASGETHFAYGNHVVKAHLKRVTEDMPRNAGVVVFSESDIPLGFGVAARGTDECRSAATETIVVYHQADVGEYLREEADLL